MQQAVLTVVKVLEFMEGVEDILLVVTVDFISEIEICGSFSKLKLRLGTTVCYQVDFNCC